MTKSRQQLLLDGLNSKCVLGVELARQLLVELNACGPFTTTTYGYRAANGRFFSLAFVQAWIIVQLKYGAQIRQRSAPQGKREARIAIELDNVGEVRTQTPTQIAHQHSLTKWGIAK